MRKQLSRIFDLLYERRGIDFSGNFYPDIFRKIEERVIDSHKETIQNYVAYLVENPIELNNLIDSITVNVSRFFRNSLTFELLSSIVLPSLLNAKKKRNDRSIRVWSAGCSEGEEPYSVSILMSELLGSLEKPFDMTIFGTDINHRALEKAKEARYSYDSVSDIKLKLIEKYFRKIGDQYHLDSIIRDSVEFHFYDLLDQRTAVPSESIFGGFDLILCRNVMIYLNPLARESIFSKLFQALNPGGILVLGAVEIVPSVYAEKLIRKSNYGKIYQKL